MKNLKASDQVKHILILVENLSVPFDRRVWQESCALRDAGYRITVICPKGSTQDFEGQITIDGIRIKRYSLNPAGSGPFGYLHEYATAMLKTIVLTLRIRFREPIHAIHACNPPDLFFLIALILRPWGTKFVYDQHDLVPELLQSRFGNRPFLFKVALLLERASYGSAHAVISTNESYKSVAQHRGKKSGESVTVVRSAPDLDRFKRQPIDRTLFNGKKYLLAYLGVMGPQDGVDFALRAIRHLREDLGRQDVFCIFMGAGDSYQEMISLSSTLGIDDIIDFPGRVPDEFVQRCLSSADICLSPDPANELNNVSTMNKVLEYMAIGKPIVSFDLVEARISAGEAAKYVPDNDEFRFAEAIDMLLKDESLRVSMGEIGRKRIENELSWEYSKVNLVNTYSTLFGKTR
jgi:glycosyltransferase involved in cell wall biosynthesis